MLLRFFDFECLLLQPVRLFVDASQFVFQVLYHACSGLFLFLYACVIIKILLKKIFTSLFFACLVSVSPALWVPALYLLLQKILVCAFTITYELYVYC